MSAADIKRAKRYAVKFNPPCIFLEYEDVEGRSRLRAVKLVSVTADTDVDRLTRKVIRSFPRSLDASSVKYEQVRKLVFKLVEHVRHHGPIQQNTSSTSSSAWKLTTDIQDGSSMPITPQAHPAESPKLPEQGGAGLRHRGDRLGGLAASDGLLHSTDSRFSTSSSAGPMQAAGQQIERGKEGLSPVGKQQLQGLSGLDDLLEDLDKELGPQPTRSAGSMGRRASMQGYSEQHADSTQLHGTTASAVQHTDTPRAVDVDSDEEELDQLVLEPDLQQDLNHVSEVELKMAKQRMDQEFLRHQLRPGDEGYQYDLQVEFEAPVEDCGWDDADD